MECKTLSELLIVYMLGFISAEVAIALKLRHQRRSLRRKPISTQSHKDKRPDALRSDQENWLRNTLMPMEDDDDE